MRISRTWGTLDSSLSFLIPNANYMTLFKRYFEGSMRRRNKPRKILRSITAGVQGTVATIGEYRSILEPLIRRQAIFGFALGGTSERMLSALSVVFRFVRVGLIFALCLSVLIFIEVFYDWFDIAFVERFSDDFEWLSHEWWLVKLGFLALLIVCFKKVVQRLERRN
jgi:hypothetical protein